LHQWANAKAENFVSTQVGKKLPLKPLPAMGGLGGFRKKLSNNRIRMKLINYLSAKYGTHTPTTILYNEARVFGIPMPLENGWLKKYGELEITPDVEAKMKKYLQQMIDRNHPRSESAKTGIKILNDAYLTLKLKPNANSDDFLQSKSWKRLRIQAFDKYGNFCSCCGAKPTDGIRLNVDHIKPRKIFPELALNLDNLQVLCEDCNSGKGNWNMTNFKGEV
jgi:hypothetical protein